MRKVRGNLCRTSKGRFARCRGKVSGYSNGWAKGRRKTKSSSKRRCKKGVVKSGPRKGMCRKR